MEEKKGNLGEQLNSQRKYEAKSIDPEKVVAEFEKQRLMD